MKKCEKCGKFGSSFWKNMGNKLLLNGPPIAYESDKIAFKIIHQNLQTATCHKVSTSKKFFADIILIKKLSRINTNQCDDIFKVHGHNTTYD